MNTQNQQNTNQPVQSNDSLLDLDSDEPMQACPMRKDGMAPGEICEACQ